MTYQGGPDPTDPDPINRGRDYQRYTSMRTDEGGWNVIPLLLGAVFVILLGYLFFGNRGDQPGVSRDASRVEQPGAPSTSPGTSTMPRTAPTPPVPAPTPASPPAKTGQ